MRSRTHPDLEGRCRRCYLREAHCICGDIPRVPNRTRVVVIRHAFEAPKSTNTARIALLALGRAELVPYDPGSPPDLDAELARAGHAWLVYPGESSAEARGELPESLVVLDGTWPQARRMIQRHTALRRLPVLGLADPVHATRRLRSSPAPTARSTLEAIASALRLVEGEAVASPLDALHALFVARTLAARGAPKSPP